MENLVYLLGPLGCAAGMVVCMAMMARDARRHDEAKPGAVQDPALPQGEGIAAEDG